LAVLSVGVYYLHRWQAGRVTGIFLEKARQAETEGNLVKAIDLYGRYLAIAPMDADARWQYGTLLVNAHAHARAFQAFEAVLRLDPARSDVRRKAVVAAMAIGRLPDARDHLENYLLKESPDDPELLLLEGQCLARVGEYVAAGRSLQAAIQRDPARIAAYTELIAVLSRSREDLDKDREKWLANLPREQQTALKQDKDWAEKTADYWTDRLVKANPKDPQVYVFRGHRQGRKGLLDNAIQDAEVALKLKSDDPEALNLAAMSYLLAKQPDKSREYATRGVKAAPKDFRMYEILADIDRTRQEPKESLKWLQMGVDANGPPLIWWKLGISQIAQGKFEEAKETAKSLRTKVFSRAQLESAPVRVAPSVYADLLEAQLSQIQGHWQDATKQIGQIGVGLKADPILARAAFYSQGKTYEQLADFERALKAYRQAVDADPMWMPAREAVAATLQSLGRSGEALEERRNLAESKDAPLNTRVALIRESIAKISQLSADKRDWSEVDKLLNQLGEVAPNSTAVPLLQAELLIAQDRAAEATKLIETVRDKDPKEIAYWIALVNLAIRENQWDKAGQSLEEAEKKFGDRATLRLARAQFWTRKGQKGAAEQLRKLAEKSKDFSPQEQVGLWQGLVSASLAVDDIPQAVRLCQLLMALLPGDLNVRLELFTLARETNDVKLMDTTLAEIGRVESSGPIWHYATALRLVFSYNEMHAVPAVQPAGEAGKSPPSDEQGKALLSQAQEHLAEALRLRANWSRALLLQGLIYEELRQENAALTKYLEAVQQGETSPEVAQRALHLFYAKGEYAAANALLRQLEGKKVLFTTELFREQSRVLKGMKDYSGALKSAQQVAATSKDYRDYLTLSQLLSIHGQPDEAEKALQQASLLNERAPEILVAQVQFFVRAGKKDRAEQILASGREKIPAAQAPLALAACFEILGKTEEAGQQYAFALKQKPDDPGLVRSLGTFYMRHGNLAKAAEQLVRIVDGQVHAAAQQVAESRADLARVRADQGGYQNLLEALRLVDQNLAAAPSSADNLRLKARFLAAHPQSSRRREAVAIYEKLAENQTSALAEDRFLLAQLYLASQDWPKARGQLLALLSTQNNQPQYIAAYVRGLLERKEFAEAEQWIVRLEEAAPDGLPAAQLRAEVQFRTGQAEEAIATWTKFIEKAPANSPARLARMRAAAAHLEAMGSGPRNTVGMPAATTAKEKAESFYRQYVDADPKQGLVLVNFLVRQKRFDEALQFMEDAWKVAEPPQIALSCQQLLAQPGITAAQVARVAGILAAAEKKYPQAAPLLGVMAAVREAQGRFQEAEAIYRELLQKNKQFVPALNNLAVLLALGGRQLNEARDLIESAVALEGPNSSLLDTRATVYLARGETEKALADLNELVAQGASPQNYFHLALAQRKAGQQTAAADSLRKARDLKIRPEALHPLERPVYDELVRSML
jgi:tetratricopeptide (TPR) repeat protein